jgi:hypothetical protein
MAKQYKQVSPIPLATALSHTTFDKTLFYHAASVIYDDTWSGPRDVCIFFHGATPTPPVEASAPAEPNDYYVAKEICDRGCIAIMFKNFGSKYEGGSLFSSASPYSSSYGNVNSPAFGALLVKIAWMVQSAIEFVYSPLFSNLFPSSSSISVDRLGLFGHSLGASAVCSWSSASGTPGFEISQPLQPKFILANAPTLAGGSSAYTWNRPQRVINSVSQTVSQMKHRSVLFYGATDTYAPQDFARRIQFSLGDSTSNPKTSVVNTSGGHTWALYSSRTPDWGDLMNQLFDEQASLTFRGSSIVFGA